MSFDFGKIDDFVISGTGDPLSLNGWECGDGLEKCTDPASSPYFGVVLMSSIKFGCCHKGGRDAVVNRLLDWTKEAQESGRVERADALMVFAWDVYDRLTP